MGVMPKEKVIVAIEENLLEWVDREACNRLGFESRSQVFEYALRLMKEGFEHARRQRP